MTPLEQTSRLLQMVEAAMSQPADAVGLLAKAFEENRDLKILARRMSEEILALNIRCDELENQIASQRWEP